MPSPRHAVTFATIAVAIVALVLIQAVTDMPLPLGLALAAAVSVGILRSSRNSLQIGRYFPELLKIPVLRQLIARPDAEVGPRA